MILASYHKGIVAQRNLSAFDFSGHLAPWIRPVLYVLAEAFPDLWIEIVEDDC